MPNDRTVTIKNTGDTVVCVVLNYGDADLRGFDLMPGNTVETSVGDAGCVAILDARSLAIFGQNVDLVLPPE